MDRGYVRSEDEAPRQDPEAGQDVDMPSTEGQSSDGSGVQRTAISVAGSASDTDDDDEDAARPLPARVSCTKDAAAHRLTDLVRYVLPASPAAITVPAWQRRLLRMTAMRVRADC